MEWSPIGTVANQSDPHYHYNTTERMWADGPPDCATYSWRAARLVSVAGDGHHVGPVVRLHGHSGGVGAAHMEGGGAAAVRALDARPRLPLPRVAFPAVDAPLQETRAEGESVTRGNTRPGLKGPECKAAVVRAPLLALQLSIVVLDFPPPLHLLSWRKSSSTLAQFFLSPGSTKLPRGKQEACSLRTICQSFVGASHLVLTQRKSFNPFN